MTPLALRSARLEFSNIYACLRSEPQRIISTTLVLVGALCVALQTILLAVGGTIWTFSSLVCLITMMCISYLFRRGYFALPCALFCVWTDVALLYYSGLDTTASLCIYFGIVPLVVFFSKSITCGFITLVAAAVQCAIVQFAIYHPRTLLGITELAAPQYPVTYICKFALFAGIGAMAFLFEYSRSIAAGNLEKTLQHKEAVKQRLRRTSQTKIQVMANVSHELRTPLHGIIAMSSELLEMDLSKEAREATTVLCDSAEHLNILVTGLLDFERIESNQLTLVPAPFSLRNEVTKVANIFTMVAQRKGVHLASPTFVVASDMREGDSLRFRQVLFNLLSNAVKFTDSGGNVSLAVCSSPSAPDRVEVSVVDTGIGIDAEHVPKLFSSFSQLDLARRYGGSGLGLAVARRLVHLMGGDITCSSTVGCGTAFNFYVVLPAATPGASALPTARDEAPASDHLHDLIAASISVGALPSEAVAGAKEAVIVPETADTRVPSILLAEDNVVNQKVALRMLSGYDVVVANNGALAVAAFERRPFDAVLMDCQMPVMDGFEATRRIRELESFTGSRHTPIIALTASGDYRRCAESGMDDFLAKPLQKDDLLCALEKVGASHRTCLKV